MPGVTLARPISDDGEFGDFAVAVAFWCASEFGPEAHKLVQRVSGVDLVFPIPPEHLFAFQNKEIDYSAERAFHLRERSRGRS